MAPSSSLFCLISILLLLLLSPHGADGADSYDLVEDQASFTSDYRVLIGVPGDDFLPADDNGKARARREKTKKIVEAHIERMAEKSVIEGIDVQYAYITDDDPGFLHFFPKHTKLGKGDLDEPLALPAVRMMNAATGDFMLPDWEILLMELPDELDRLVGDFERWMVQTDKVTYQTDGVMLLNSKNLGKAVADTPLIFTAFYAPWCHFSQAMLPKVGGASKMVAELVEKSLLAPNAVAVGIVNVDEEGSLRKAYNVSTYPTLLMLGGDGNERHADTSNLGIGIGSSSSSNGRDEDLAAAKGLKFDGSGLPFAKYSGDGESAADIAAHLATVAFGSPTLASEADVEALTGLSRAVDGFFRDAEEGAEGAAATGEDGGRKKTTVSVVLFHPSVKGGYKTAVDGSLVAAVRNFVGIKETFVTATNDAALAEKTFLDLGFLKTAAEAAATTKAAADAAAASGGATAATLLVATRANGVVAVPLPKTQQQPQDGGKKGAAAGAAAAAAAAAAPAAKKKSKRGWGWGSKDDDDGAGSAEAAAKAAKAAKAVEAAEAAATEAAAESLSAATRAAILKGMWPAVSRFSSGTAQGERIRSGIMRRLAVLVADEGDAFMWDGFLETFTAAAQQLRGEAFFLYADDDEPRIAPLLRTAGVGHGGGPVVVVIGMGGGGEPQVLSAEQITVEAIEAALMGSGGKKDEL
jgi:thiol-disulfide isomerase/thioredoxin